MAFCALENVYTNCVCLNNCNKNLIEVGTSSPPGPLSIEEDYARRNMCANERIII